jgi:hypothetical protein
MFAPIPPQLDLTKVSNDTPNISRGEAFLRTDHKAKVRTIKRRLDLAWRHCRGTPEKMLPILIAFMSFS